MGFRYSKSLNVGPFRVNLSKSGVGYSIGGRGFRTGVRATGRSYSSVSLPGTGMSYVKQGKGCMLLLAAYFIMIPVSTYSVINLIAVLLR